MRHLDLHLSRLPWLRVPPALLRRVLGVLLGFGALCAFGGGGYGLSGAPGVPTTWLAGSPFSDYFVPSFVLLVVVGGSQVVAAIAVLAEGASARRLTASAGAILCGWIAAQVAILGFVSWLQPTMAALGVVYLLAASALPEAPGDAPASRSFVSYYAGVVLRPRATFDALMGDPRRLKLGTLALLLCAALYTLVYVFLVMGHGRPTVFTPWLAIDPEDYYRWNVFLVAPAMLMSWLLAAAVAHLVARAWGGHGSFEDTLAALGFGVAIASWCTLLHDLVTTFLGAVHVIDQRAYEDAMSSPTPFRTMLWALMLAYLVAFVVLFAKGLGAAHRLPKVRAAALGALAFVAYQLVFVLFNR